MKNYQQLAIFICQLFIVLAMEMVNPFIPAYVQQLTGGSVQDVALSSALVIMAPMLGMMLMAPVWGMLADKYGYKPMLIRAAIALVVMQLLIGIAINVWQLLSIRFMQGCFSGFIAAMQSYAMSQCNWSERGQVLGRLQSAKAIGTAFGGSIGGLAIICFGLHHIFQVAACACLLPLGLILFLPNGPVYKHPSGEQKSPTPYSFSLILIGSLIVVSQIAKFLPNAVFPLYVEQILKGNPLIVGLLYSLPGIAIIIGSNWMGQFFDKQRTLAKTIGSAVPLIYYFLFLGGLGALVTLCHSLTNNLTLIILIRFLWGLVFAGLLPALLSVLTDWSTRQGFIIGMGNSLAKLGNLLGVVLGGYGASRMPVHFLFIFSSLSYGLIMLLCLNALKHQSSFSMQYKS